MTYRNRKYDRCPQKDVARRFGYSYAAFRQLVHEFRGRCAAGQPPPFFTRRRGGARRAVARPGRAGPSAPRSPIAASSG
jgi:hypothetical protein